MKKGTKLFIGLILIAFFYYAGFVGTLYDYAAGPFFLALAFSSTILLIILFALGYGAQKSGDENGPHIEKVFPKRWKFR